MASVRGMRLVLALLLPLAPATARALDDPPYPDWAGAWIRIGSANTFADETAGPPPLTPEYRAQFERKKAERLAGRVDDNPTVRCQPPGMPRAMVATDPMEIVITPKTTYVIISYFKIVRRIYTDGRDWPADHERRATAIRSVIGLHARPRRHPDADRQGPEAARPPPFRRSALKADRERATAVPEFEVSDASIGRDFGAPADALRPCKDQQWSDVMLISSLKGIDITPPEFAPVA